MPNPFMKEEDIHVISQSNFKKRYQIQIPTLKQIVATLLMSSLHQNCIFNPHCDCSFCVNEVSTQFAEFHKKEKLPLDLIEYLASPVGLCNQCQSPYYYEPLKLYRMQSWQNVNLIPTEYCLCSIKCWQEVNKVNNEKLKIRIQRDPM